MGIIRDLIAGRRNDLIDAATSGPSFAVDAESIPPEVFGLVAYAEPTAIAPRVARKSAVQVPAVKRCRDLIAGTLGGLPLDLVPPADANPRANYAELLDQPERHRARSITIAQTFEDMLYEGVAWWRIVELGWHGFPTKVKRVAPHRVTVDEDRDEVRIDGKVVTSDEVIRIDSPTDGLLTAGARAIRTCLTLDAAAGRYADGAPPLTYFAPTEHGVDPFDDDEETEEFLNDFETARRNRATAYVPGVLDLKTLGWNPEQLQLADARQHAVLEIARVAGVDPEELGVSTTSRTYANQFDRRKAFIDFTLGQYRQAFEDRLSMNDVTPRGYQVRMNLSAFLRSDDKTRMETYILGLRVGAYDHDEIRELEDKPPLDNPPRPEELPTVNPPRQITSEILAANGDLGPSFDVDPVVRLDAPQAPASFEVDVERRIIRGLAVPYGVVGISGGQRWQFSQGTLKFSDVRRVKLWIQHDRTQAVGVATKFEDTPAGALMEFKVARGPEGDRALQLAEDGVLDGLSIGLAVGGKFATRSGVHHAIEAPLMEVSLTPAPSFDDARVHAVAAEAAQERNTMKCTKCGIVHPAGVVECNAADVAAFEAAQNGPSFDQAALTEAIQEAISAGFSNLEQPQRETVSATAGGAEFEVTEPSPYRFDGTQGEASFSDDLRSYQSDPEARQRLDTFMGEAFAVSTSNTSALNPTKNRPDLFVPNLTFTRPLWELVSTGTVEDKTPFTIPKFQSAADLVGPHTEGTEPTPGSFSATSQTVNPAPVSGKVEINREVWDQGGSPQADQIIWGEILNAYFEAIEAQIATRLNGLSLTEINLGGATDDALVDLVEGIFIDLQYVRGGNRFSAFAADGNLFKNLSQAKDSAGRKLLPIAGPSNADGSVSGGFDRIALGNQAVRAAWALGGAGSNETHSYLFVPSSVWAWASAPKRFVFEYQVKSVDLAVWGYTASAVTRDSDVKRIDYTTSDTDA